MKNSRQKTGLALLILLAALAGGLSSCGYRNISRARAPAGEIYFPLMANESREPGAETLLGRALSERLLRSGFRLANTPAAPYQVTGRVTTFETTGLAARAGREQIDLSLEIEIELSGRESPGPEFLPPVSATFREEFSYFRAGPYALSDSRAFSRAADELAIQVVEWLSVRFGN